jgi:glycosyltransferase involved in cell wall biosynthesis
VEQLNISGKFNPFATGRIKGIGRKFGADIIHTHLSTASQWGLQVARSLGIPGIGHIHSFNSVGPYRAASKIVAVSNAVKQHLVNTGLEETSIEVIYPASHTPVPEPAYDIQKFSGVTICCASRIREDKGVRVLFEAFEEVLKQGRNCRLLYCGDGPLLCALSARAEQRNLPIQFLGYRPDVSAVFAASDIAILPSIAPEGYGLASVEAQAVGIPIIASDVGGAAEAIRENVTGILVPPNDSSALARALLLLVDSDSKRKHMGMEARQFAAQRTIAASADQLLSLFDKSVRNH